MGRFARVPGGPGSAANGIHSTNRDFVRYSPEAKRFNAVDSRVFRLGNDLRMSDHNTDDNACSGVSGQPPIVDRRSPADIAEPPSSLWGTLLKIGPGLIIAANIVGSGELIMTTKTGAEAGITLLWLIVLGCVVKVFVQLEFGRFTISHGETTLSSLNRIPGPRIAGVNWVVAGWAVMMLASIAQLGGIVGGVGQSLAITFPISGDYRDAVLTPSTKDIMAYVKWQAAAADPGQSAADSRATVTDERVQRRMNWIASDLAAIGPRGKQILDLATAGQPLVDESGRLLVDGPTNDDRVWVLIIGAITSVLLFRGRYRFIETASVVLVVSFTFITIGNVFALQNTRYALSTEQILHGFSFRLPEYPGAMLTALAAFGIIGVGATELVSYPYWCLEKGYARSAGPRDQSDEWLKRAQGWFGVMKSDAYASMVIYTLATAAFFFLGASVLHSDGRNPEDSRMVSTLAESYVPVFGGYAKWLFLAGAIAVLYSTYLVANAGNARMMADFCGVIGINNADPDSAGRRKLIRGLSTALPLICVGVFMGFQKTPVELIVLSGLTQGIMLPILGFSSLYFRYKLTDTRLRPGHAWDAILLISCLALLITGVWGTTQAVLKLL